MKSNYRPIGDYIRKVENRNKDLKVTKLLGLSMTKEFRETTSNIVGTDMSVYKVMSKYQFACDFMSPIRVSKLPVVLKLDDEPNLVSPAYPVFEIIDRNKLDPEYLMMWFRRPEFDRYATFKCDAAIRGGYEWDELCETLIPVPSITKQREIVKEYNVVQKRIALNQELIQKLEETAQAIYKQWFVDFEFPDENGKPYKSSGGEMVESELGEIPKEWRIGKLGDLIELQRGFDLATQNRRDGLFPIYASTGIAEYHNEFKVKAPGIVTGRSGSLGEVFYIDEDFWPLNTTLWIKNFKNATPIYAFYVLKGINIRDYNSGSAVPTLNRNHIHLHQLIIPQINVIKRFEEIEKKLFHQIKTLTKEHSVLQSFGDILLSKLATIEN